MPDVTDEQEVPCPEAQESQLGTNDMMLEDTDSGLALLDGSEDQEKNTDSESGANSEVSPTRANTRYPLRDPSKRQQPLRLMEVSSTLMCNSSGRTDWRKGVM